MGLALYVDIESMEMRLKSAYIITPCYNLFGEKPETLIHWIRIA